MVVEMVLLKGGIGSIYSPNWQLKNHLYTTYSPCRTWVVIDEGIPGERGCLGYAKQGYVGVPLDYRLGCPPQVASHHQDDIIFLGSGIPT